MNGTQDHKMMFKDGAVIFKEGDAGDVAYLVRSGGVSLVRNTAAGPTPLASVGPNSLFGEMALIDGSRRMATAIAVGETMCSVVGLKQLGDKLGALPPAVRSDFEMMIKYVRETLPWSQRQKDVAPAAVAVTETDLRIWSIVPLLDVPLPAAFADPVMKALYKLVLDYVRRRSPPERLAR